VGCQILFEDKTSSDVITKSLLMKEGVNPVRLGFKRDTERKMLVLCIGVAWT
jgi:hypothetical protein